LVCWYHHAKALIFPQEEDFGIVSLEAQAAGTPVIATNVGGAAETVVHHQTGLLFDRLDEGTLPQALDAFGNHTWYDKVIRRHAQRFNTGVFRQRFKKYSEELWLRHQKSLSKR
jgi:glycosyltransferase involved in cell wall biosynthesis